MPLPINFSIKWPPHSYQDKLPLCPEDVCVPLLLGIWGSPTPLTAQEHVLHCVTFHLKRHLQKWDTKMQNMGLPLLIHIPQNLVRTSRNSLKVGKHVCWATRRQSVCWAKTHLSLCEVTSHSGLLC